MSVEKNAVIKQKSPVGIQHTRVIQLSLRLDNQILLRKPRRGT